MEMKIGNLFKGDKVVWMVFFLLCMISIVEVFSASSNLTYESQNYMKPIAKHTSTVIAGVVVAIVILHIPCRYFKLLALPLLVTSAVLLVSVYFLGERINDGGRWIKILGFTFQPSEIAKGTMVLVTAQILSAMQRENGADRAAFKYILCCLVPIFIAIGVENLSTAILLFGVIYLMMIIGRIPKSQMWKLTGVVGVLVAVALTLILTLGKTDSPQTDNATMTETVSINSEKDETTTKKSFDIFHRMGTWRNRIITFFDNKEVPPEKYDLVNNWQVAHANIAITGSNIIGKGPGNSVERDYLPQAFADFIFTIIIEEMGIIGATLVVFLYIVLLYRASRIASRCENNFPAFLIMGLTLLLVCQAISNMMVAVGIAPVTGQPLPLISKGGTSTIINCAYIGVILSISRSAKMKVKEAISK